MKSLRIAARVAGFAALVVLALAIYLVFVGVPGSVAEGWLSGKLGSHADIQCDHIRLAPLRGIIAKNVAITSRSEGANRFRFDAEEVVLSVGRTRRSSGRVGQLAFSFVNGMLRRGPSAGLPLPRLSGYVERQGDQVTIRQCEGLTGNEGETGVIRGDLMIDFAEERYDGTIETACQPSQFTELMPTNLAGVVASLHFEEPPLTMFRLSGRLGQLEAVAVHGRIFADRLERHGVQIELMHAGLHYENDVLHLEEILAVRPEGAFRGSVQQDFITKEIAVQARSGANPLAVARVIHPKFEAWIEPYLPPAPTELTGSIAVNYQTNRHIEIHADVRGKGLGYKMIKTDYGTACVDMSGKSIRVTDINGTWCGGSITGSVCSDVEGPNTNRFVELNIDIAKAELAEVMAVFKDSVDSDAHPGKVYAHLELRGETQRFKETLDGRGTLRLRHVNLLSTRVGRELSHYLSKLRASPGSTASQKFEASFNLAGRRLQINEMLLHGGFYTIKGSGTIAFDGALDLKVRVEFQREGLGSRVVQVLTLPATLLLDFECTGTVQDPRWRAVRGPQGSWTSSAPRKLWKNRPPEKRAIRVRPEWH